MKVSNLVKEVDLIFACKQRGANAVHRRVAPTLLKETSNVRSAPLKVSVLLAHLIVKSSLLIQKFDELRVCLTSPEVEVANLKVTPN